MLGRVTPAAVRYVGRHLHAYSNLPEVTSILWIGLDWIHGHSALHLTVGTTSAMSLGSVPHAMHCAAHFFFTLDQRSISSNPSKLDSSNDTDCPIVRIPATQRQSLDHQRPTNNMRYFETESLDFGPLMIAETAARRTRR